MDCFTRLWTVKLGDWGRGLVIAILSIPISILYDWATMDDFELSAKAIIRGAVAGGLAYVGKNFITGPSGKMLKGK